MDGQRLMIVDGGVYGDVGREYRTEIDGISRITSKGGSLAEGPSGWVVETKAGQTIEYGSTADSTLDTWPDGLAVRPISSDTEYPIIIVNWMISKITDAAGNEISFTYIKDDATGEQYIHRIDYAENSIRFDYEDVRPDKRKDIRQALFQQFRRGFQVLVVTQVNYW